MHAALIVAVLLLGSVAQPRRSEPVYIDFASTARVPAAVLTPGTYVFVPGRAVAGQIVIDIYRARDMSLVVSCLAIEIDRLPEGQSMLTDFPGTAPPYLRAWFHPGFRRGYAFVYAPEEAAAIFAASATSVPSTAFSAGSSSLMGLLPIAHLDDQYRGGVPEWAAALPVPFKAPGPLDHLALARVAVLTHLHDVPPDTAARLALLNRQMAALTASYVDGRPDLLRRLALVEATVGNSALAFSGDRETTHVLERVRAQIAAFAAVLR